MADTTTTTTTTTDPKSHQERHPDGGISGRDPRRMSPEALEAAGVQRQSRGAAIRRHCFDCAGGSTAEVRRCALSSCPLWAFRMGTNPWSNRAPMPEDQRQAAADRLAEGRAARRRDAAS
jgi:hypothetical protein